ncbi:hypothetical protein [Bacillus paramycoides]|uniref:hypothetical protein n=1 Tax=Bacillus paramycoides TaxID=2026194 RepID=UPI002E1AD42B|nr:hypothetical protein [Bacillus paramycoides]
MLRNLAWITLVILLALLFTGWLFRNPSNIEPNVNVKAAVLNDINSGEGVIKAENIPYSPVSMS